MNKENINLRFFDIGGNKYATIHNDSFTPKGEVVQINYDAGIWKLANYINEKMLIVLRT